VWDLRESASTFRAWHISGLWVANFKIALAALTGGIALALCQVTPARTQSYPARPIKQVVPFGPGGPTDVSARIVAQVVQSGLGQSVVIKNRPGAGGALGSKSVAAAESDGATLLIGTSATLGVVPALVKSPGYDPIKSFAPVAKVADSTLVLVAPAQFPASSVRNSWPMPRPIRAS
jgi:tripartite-type tricarboxylate transporter receptor subunit TctC